MQEISHIQKIFVDSHERAQRAFEGKAPRALLVEGATQAPLIVSKVEPITLEEEAGYIG
jgi:hypothetical protein